MNIANRDLEENKNKTFSLRHSLYCSETYKILFNKILCAKMAERNVQLKLMHSQKKLT